MSTSVQYRKNIETIQENKDELKLRDTTRRSRKDIGSFYCLQVYEAYIFSAPKNSGFDQDRYDTKHYYSSSADIIEII
jgi:hypothetical protein